MSGWLPGKYERTAAMWRAARWETSLFVVVDVLNDLDGNGDQKAADKYKEEILGGLEPFRQDKQMLWIVQVRLPPPSCG